MWIDSLNLEPSESKALELGINDLRDDYLDRLFVIRRRAEVEAEQIIDEHGNDLNLLRDCYDKYAMQANELAQNYYAGVRDLWDSVADLGLPSYEGAIIDADHAAWKQFGGLNNTDHPGYTFDSIANAHNKANLTIDDMWAQGVRNLDSDGLVKLAGQIVRQTARLTIQETVDSDASRPRYARVPRGSKTCAFCVMLASRGFAYSTERSAGGEDDKYHDDCDCMIIPSWGATRLRGYDPDRYMAMYREAQRRSGSSDRNEILQWMRHTYPKELSDGRIPQKQRASWEVEKAFTSMNGEKSLSRRAWNRRQRAIGIPTDWDVLEMHEIVFMERFAAAGQHFKWIPKDETEFKPTNDFHWEERGLDVEVKGTTKRRPDYRTLASLIRKASVKASKSGVTKDSFILDLHGASISDKLISQLSEYNKKNHLHIKHLFIADDNHDEPWEIELK